MFSSKIILYLADISQCFCSSDAAQLSSAIGDVFFFWIWLLLFLSESLEKQKDKYVCLVNHLESEIKESLHYFSTRISPSLSKVEGRVGRVR